MAEKNRLLHYLIPGLHFAVLSVICLSMPLAFTGCMGCSGEIPVTGDSTNAVIIDNPGTPPNPPVTVALREELSVGNIDDEHTFFLKIGDIDVDDQGNIYVLETKSMEIRMFDKTGRFMRTFAGKGEGPGEFIRPTDLAVDHRKQTICVSDWKNKKISLFQQDGTLHREIKLTFTPGGLGIDANGNYMAASSFSDNHRGVYTKYIRIVKLDPDGDAESRSPDFIETIKKAVTISKGMLIFSMPFSPKGLFCYRDYSRSFYYAFPDKYEISMYNNRFDKIKIISRQNPYKKAVTEEAKEKFIRDYIEMGEAENKGALYRKTARYFQFPDYFPLISALWEDESGHLLVKTASRDTRVYIDVFDQTGVYQRQLIVDNPTNGVSADAVMHAGAVLRDGCLYSVVSIDATLFIKRFRMVDQTGGEAKAGFDPGCP